MEQIITKRLTMTSADINDLPALEGIDRECGRYFEFDPKCEMNHDCSLEECLTIGDIPTGVKKEDYRRENNYFTAFGRTMCL